MKTKKIEKMLNLSKETIANLGKESMADLKGGQEWISRKDPSKCPSYFPPITC